MRESARINVQKKETQPIPAARGKRGLKCSEGEESQDYQSIKVKSTSTRAKETGSQQGSTKSMRGGRQQRDKKGKKITTKASRGADCGKKAETIHKRIITQ